MSDLLHPSRFPSVEEPDVAATVIDVSTQMDGEGPRASVVRVISEAVVKAFVDGSVLLTPFTDERIFIEVRDGKVVSFDYPDLTIHDTVGYRHEAIAPMVVDDVDPSWSVVSSRWFMTMRVAYSRVSQSRWDLAIQMSQHSTHPKKPSPFSNAIMEGGRNV